MTNIWDGMTRPRYEKTAIGDGLPWNLERLRLVVVPVPVCGPALWEVWTDFGAVRVACGRESSTAGARAAAEAAAAAEFDRRRAVYAQELADISAGRVITI